MNYEIWAACITASGALYSTPDDVVPARMVIEYAKKLYEEFIKQAIVGNAGADKI
jgi:hypothetical protein